METTFTKYENKIMELCFQVAQLKSGHSGGDCEFKPQQ